MGKAFRSFPGLMGKEDQLCVEVVFQVPKTEHVLPHTSSQDDHQNSHSIYLAITIASLSLKARSLIFM